MADPMIVRPFAMHMVRDFIPKVLQPWTYLMLAIIFQLVSTTYMGNSAQMVGVMNLMREDVSFIFLYGVIGVTMPRVLKPTTSSIVLRQIRLCVLLLRSSAVTSISGN